MQTRWVSGVTRGLTLAALAAALGLSLASTDISSFDEQYQACCNCLSRSRNDFSEPCIADSTAQCVDKISQGEPVSSSARCLRDLCGDDCSEVSAPATGTIELSDCCACLAENQDPSGIACMAETAAQCTEALDNGRQVASTQACFDDICRGRCGFLSLNPSDAGIGAVDGG